MPLNPPKDRGPVVATRPVPTGVRVGVGAGVAVAVIVLFMLELSRVMDTLGFVGYGLYGLVGASAVLIPKQTSYAAGRDWIRRGDNWVVTTELTQARLDGQTLRMRDRSPRRKIALPMEVLVNSEGLFTALAGGIQRSHTDGNLQADDRVRDLFSLPSHATGN